MKLIFFKSTATYCVLESNDLVSDLESRWKILEVLDML